MKELEIIFFSSILWKFILIRRVNNVSIPPRLFTVRPVSGARPS